MTKEEKDALVERLACEAEKSDAKGAFRAADMYDGARIALTSLWEENERLRVNLDQWRTLSHDNAKAADDCAAELAMATKALKPFAADKLPALRRTHIGYDANGLRRGISPMELAVIAARSALATIEGE